MKKRYQQFGWTLIELLIVLASVAILTAILVTSMIQPAMTRKSNQLLLNNVTALVDAAHNYRLAHSSYGADDTGKGLLDADNGIMNYLYQAPNATQDDPSTSLWNITSDGTITCPEGDNPSTCPQSINVSDDFQEFTLTVAGINNMASIEGLLEQSGGTVLDDPSGDDDPSSGFTVTYD